MCTYYLYMYTDIQLEIMMKVFKIYLRIINLKISSPYSTCIVLYKTYLSLQLHHSVLPVVELLSMAIVQLRYCHGKC